MATYTIRLEGGRSFSCPDHRPLLFAAWEQGVPLPYGCRAGGCGRCLVRLLEGRLDRNRQRLGAAPLVQLCRSYPLSDCLLALQAPLSRGAGDQTAIRIGSPQPSRAPASPSSSASPRCNRPAVLSSARASRMSSSATSPLRKPERISA